jgi:hypothetical protein
VHEGRRACGSREESSCGSSIIHIGPVDRSISGARERDAPVQLRRVRGAGRREGGPFFSHSEHPKSDQTEDQKVRATSRSHQVRQNQVGRDEGRREGKSTELEDTVELVVKISFPMKGEAALLSA